MKKQYEVELVRTSYITVYVEADNEDEAQALAWKEVEGRNDSNHAAWDINHVEGIA